VSEDIGAVPAPYVLDASVVIAVARGDAEIMTLIQGFDAGGQPMLVPVLAITCASMDVRSEEADELLAGFERLEHAEVVPLQGAEEAAALAAVIAKTGLDPYDAHVAAVADETVSPVLTLDGAKWRQHAGDLDEPLHIVEISDPDDDHPRG
jgi:predicted nucleic acid-binding protein